MPVRKYNKYSAYYDSLNDHKAAYNLEKEQLYDTIEEVKNNSFKGKTQYEAQVLEAPVESLGSTTVPDSSTKSGSKKVFFAKVRLNDVEENMLEDPSKIADPNLRKRVIAQHKTALFSPSDGENIKTMAPGDVVECNFAIDGPDNEGRQRGLQLTSNIVSRGAGNYAYNSVGFGGSFNSNGPTLLGGPIGGQPALPGQSPGIVSGTGTAATNPVPVSEQISGAYLFIDMDSRGVTRVTSRTGKRISPVREGKVEVTHLGTDVGAVIGTPLFACFPGVVIISEGTTITGVRKGGGFGAWVVVKHENIRDNSGKVLTLYVVYGHLNSSLVQVGQQVVAGQTVATVGNEGTSTNPHLHIELWSGWPRDKKNLSNHLDIIDSFGWTDYFNEKEYFTRKDRRKKKAQ